MNHVSAGGIVWQGDKICFVRYPDGRLGFPKGTLEAGETIEQAAVREVQEEAGLQNPHIIKNLGYFTRMCRTRNTNVLKDIHMFLMEVDDFTEKSKEEVTEWLTLDEAMPRLYPEEAEFLKKVITA